MAQPTNNFTVGRDTRYVLFGPFGQVDLGILIGVSITPKYGSAASKPMNDPTIVRAIPDGWDIQLTVDRANAALDRLCVQMEATHYGGGVTPMGSMQEIITEPDGSVTRWHYTGMAIHVSNAGARHQEQVVKYTISGHARRKEAM